MQLATAAPCALHSKLEPPHILPCFLPSFPMTMCTAPYLHALCTLCSRHRHHAAAAVACACLNRTVLNLLAPSHLVPMPACL